jgi:hypothetical protein
MKIIVCLIVFGPSILFTKEIFAQKNNSSGGMNSDKAVKTDSKEITDYDSRVYNACSKEWVHLKGLATYNIKQMQSDKKFFILYRINLRNIVGKGEITGSTYKGGGVIMNKVNANFENGHTVVTDIYKVQFKAPNSTLIFTEHAHFVFANDSQRVSFNDVSDSCR